MSRANKLGHCSRNLDFHEVSANYNSLETHDKIPIKKILVAKIDPTTTHKLLLNTFAKFGKIEHCILKRQKEYEKKDKNQSRLSNQEEDREEDNESRKSYAFITYSTAEEACGAIEAGYKREISIKRQYLRVIPANTWNQPDNSDRHRKCHVCERACKLCASKFNPDEPLPAHTNFRLEDESPFSQLNNDCLRCVFNFLPFYDRVRLARVSKRWKAISEEAWLDQRKLDCDPNYWGFKSLKEMYLRNPDACSIYQIFKKCSHYLTHIDLSRFSNHLGNSILIKIADICIKLESINLKNFKFSHSGIAALAANCSNLKSITLGYTRSEHKFDKELAALFTKNRNLRKIDIDCFIIDGNCLYHIPKKSIQELTLRNCSYILRNGIYKIVRKFANLRVIKITGLPGAFGEYRNFIRSICSCTKLEVVEIPTKRRSELNNLNTEILEPLVTLKYLTKINLRGNCTMGDEFLILLTEICQNLTSVDISDCPHIRDPGLDSVTSLPKLEYLSMDTLPNVTDTVFLKSMPNIKTLLCSGCVNFHSLGFTMMLESANRLEILDLSNCKYIANNFVIDAIRRCKRTRWRCLKIYLRGTNARLAGINVRFHWDYLKLLNEERQQEELFYY